MQSSECRERGERRVGLTTKSTKDSKGEVGGFDSRRERKKRKEGRTEGGHSLSAYGNAQAGCPPFQFISQTANTQTGKGSAQGRELGMGKGPKAPEILTNLAIYSRANPVESFNHGSRFARRLRQDRLALNPDLDLPPLCVLCESLSHNSRLPESHPLNPPTPQPKHS